MVWRPLICEKWLFVHFFNFKIFQIFLYCKFRQFKLFFWTRRWCQSSKKFFSPILDLSPNYFCLQIQYLDLYSYAFFHFAHYDRQQWFLAGTGGFSHQKKFSPILDLSANYFRVQIHFVHPGGSTSSLLVRLVIFLSWFLISILTDTNPSPPTCHGTRNYNGGIIALSLLFASWVIL